MPDCVMIVKSNINVVARCESPFFEPLLNFLANLAINHKVLSFML